MSRRYRPQPPPHTALEEAHVVHACIMMVRAFIDVERTRTGRLDTSVIDDLRDQLAAELETYNQKE